jgi:acetyl esterase/lipase
MSRRFFLLPVLSLLPLFACPARLPSGDTTAKSSPFEVRAVTDVAYRDLYAGEDAKKPKNKLDLYLPKGKKDFPVLFFVHGGAWRNGDKNYFGVYSNLGMFLARHGIGAVMTNYRLSPAVQHPEHVKDVARAFAWTSRNIAQYGGRSDELFLCGHSAGGHLVSLLATDESYLKAEGLSRAAVRGVVPISGVYDVSFAGLNLLETVFGKDAEVRRQASPLAHVQAGLPPFLIIYADSDFRTCDVMSERFCKALQEKKCEARLLEVKGRNHLSVLLNATKADDPVGQAIVAFIAGHTPTATASAGQ